MDGVIAMMCVRAIVLQHTWFQIHQDCPRHIAATRGFVEVDVDALQLQVGVPVICASGVNAMLIRDHFPELGTDLIAALTLAISMLPPSPSRTRTWRVRIGMYYAPHEPPDSPNRALPTFAS